MKSNKIGLGIIGKKWFHALVKSIFKARQGYKIKHVDWENYSYGYGQDLRLFKRNRQVMASEVKNWRKMDRPYGTDIAEKEIMDRFANFSGGFKILVISFLCLLTRKAKMLLRSHNIYVIEIGKLIGKNDFPRKGKNNKVFYTFKSKFLRLWISLKWLARSKVVSHVQSSLDNYVSRNVNSCHTIKHKQHDTDSYNKAKTSQNYALQFIINLIKHGSGEYG